MASSTMRALFRQQMAADEAARTAALPDIITYERSAAAVIAPVQLSPADILAAAAYNLVLDTRATQGDVLTLLKS